MERLLSKLTERVLERRERSSETHSATSSDKVLERFLTKIERVIEHPVTPVRPALGLDPETLERQLARNEGFLQRPSMPQGQILPVPKATAAQQASVSGGGLHVAMPIELHVHGDVHGVKDVENIGTVLGQAAVAQLVQMISKELANNALLGATAVGNNALFQRSPI